MYSVLSCLVIQQKHTVSALLIINDGHAPCKHATLSHTKRIDTSRNPRNTCNFFLCLNELTTYVYISRYIKIALFYTNRKKK